MNETFDIQRLGKLFVYEVTNYLPRFFKSLMIASGVLVAVWLLSLVATVDIMDNGREELINSLYFFMLLLSPYIIYKDMNNRKKGYMYAMIPASTLEKLISDGRIHPARIEETVDKVSREMDMQIKEAGEAAVFEAGIFGLHPELIKLIGRLKFRTSYGQNVYKHSVEGSMLAGQMAAELGLDVNFAKRAGLLHDIGKVPDEEPEMPHALYGAKLAEKYKEKADICNAIGAHHDEAEMTSLLAPIVQVCDAISGARPGARREIVEAYIKRLKDLENIAMSYPGVVKTYAIQAGRELRVIVGADKIDDEQTELLSGEIATKIQNEMTYPGQVKITVIRETRSVAFAK